MYFKCELYYCYYIIINIMKYVFYESYRVNVLKNFQEQSRIPGAHCTEQPGKLDWTRCHFRPPPTAPNAHPTLLRVFSRALLWIRCSLSSSSTTLALICPWHFAHHIWTPQGRLEWSVDSVEKEDSRRAFENNSEPKYCNLSASKHVNNFVAVITVH